MKYPRTRQGMARRRSNYTQFNPANGEPHTRNFLNTKWHKRLFRGRRFTYATAERKNG